MFVFNGFKQRFTLEETEWILFIDVGNAAKGSLFMFNL